MQPDERSPGERLQARLAQALESVRPVQDALGSGVDAAWGGDLLAMYDRRPAWAVPGSVSPLDALFLGELIRGSKPRTILELGVAAGCSTSVLAWAVQRTSPSDSIRVIACDAATQWYHDPSKPVGVAIDHMLGDGDGPARAAIEIRTGVTSRTLGERIEPGTIDLAFIDADHRHPWPVVDLALVCALVRPGGWIALHDTRLEVMAKRHERKRGEPAPWVYRGPVIAFEAWPGERVHAATDSANIGAVRVPARGADREALMASVRAHPWETDPSDPELREAIRALDPGRGRVVARAPSAPQAGARSDRVRIALVSREFPPAFGGGIGTATANAAAGLVADGHTVHVITTADGASDCVTRRTVRDGLVIHRVPVARDGIDWWASRADFSARCAEVVDALGADGEIDIAEFPECEASMLVHALAQDKAGPRIPTVVQLHTPTELLFALRSAPYDGLCDSLWATMGAERACVGLADGVYAPSRFIADWSADWWGLSDRPDVVPYPHAPMIGKMSLAEPESAPTAMYIGRLEPRKGTGVVAAAWNRVAPRMPGARLVMAGSDTSHAVTGGSVRRAMERALTPEARERTMFMGPVPHRELGLLLDRARVCVVPSLWENFPNVAMEAMARGRPIVASDRGGMAEMIGASIGGVTFRSGDDEALAAALCALLAEPAARTLERGRAARSAIETLCDPITTTRARTLVYRRAIERAANRNPSDRAPWMELGHRCLDATLGRGPAIGPRPFPGFGTEIMRWVHGPRPRLAVA